VALFKATHSVDPRHTHHRVHGYQLVASMKDLKTPDDPTLELLIWRRVVSSIQEFSSGSAWRCVGHPSPGDFGAAIKLSKTPDALDALTPTDDFYRFFERRSPARRRVATGRRVDG